MSDRDTMDENGGGVDLARVASVAYRGVADHLRLRAVSWIMSLNMAAFGAITLVNPEVMSLPGRTALYETLLRYASAHTWGVVCVALGATRLAALAINGSVPGLWWSPHVRVVGSMLSALFWLQVVMGATQAGQLVLALGVFSTFTALETLALYVAALEVDPPNMRGDAPGG